MEKQDDNKLMLPALLGLCLFSLAILVGRVNQEHALKQQCMLTHDQKICKKWEKYNEDKDIRG